MAIRENNKECCGCGACESICPKHAIKMMEDEEGFLYPRVDEELCVGCGLCEKTCPLFFDTFSPPDEVASYVGTYNSDDVMFHSSSGGAFTALYEVFLQKGFTVYGVCYDECLKVIHDRATNVQECERFRKSKYVQSYYNGCYDKIVDDLKAGKSVLFSGVSCQCAALSSYLKAKHVENANLVLINLLCHGVPSQKLFDSYIKEEEALEKALVSQVCFKNKKASKGKINTKTLYLEFSNGHQCVRTTEDDAFLRGYYQRLFYRPSCGVCHFTRKDRLADFTIADAWHIEKIKSGYNSLTGVSLLLFNTPKAKAVLEEVQKKMSLEEIPTEWALSSQGLFRAPTAMHKNRERFFILWPKVGFKRAVFKCTPVSLRYRMARAIPISIRKRIRSLIH